MKFLQLIETKYGIAYVIGAMVGNGYLVSLPKSNMTQVHPNYRGGPCVCFVWQ